MTASLRAENVSASPALEVEATHEATVSEQHNLDASILVVDDRKLQRTLISAYLRKAGYTCVEEAADGNEALEKTRQIKPDLILLDIVMPDMDGYEVCRKIRSDPFLRDTPVLFQSGINSEEERSKAFDVGATDLVTKPIYAPELIARVKIHLENRFLIRELSIYQERLRYELDMAHGMQRALMPSQDVIDKLSARHNLGIAAHYEACQELGGDFWGLRSITENRLGFVSADFSGHGVTAALNTFRLHTLLDWMASESIVDAGNYLGMVNTFFTRVLPTGQFATMIIGVLDLENDRLTYSSAAHPPPILANDRSGDVRYLESAGLPVGFRKENEYTVHSTPFGEGDVLFFYSDALVETPTPADPVFTQDDLLRLAGESVGHANVKDMMESLLNRFFVRAPGPLPDDLSVLCFHRY